MRSNSYYYCCTVQNYYYMDIYSLLNFHVDYSKVKGTSHNSEGIRGQVGHKSGEPFTWDYLMLTQPWYALCKQSEGSEGSYSNSMSFQAATYNLKSGTWKDNITLFTYDLQACMQLFMYQYCDCKQF